MTVNLVHPCGEQDLAVARESAHAVSYLELREQ